MQEQIVNAWPFAPHKTILPNAEELENDYHGCIIFGQPCPCAGELVREMLKCSLFGLVPIAFAQGCKEPETSFSVVPFFIDDASTNPN